MAKRLFSDSSVLGIDAEGQIWYVDKSSQKAVNIFRITELSIERQFELREQACRLWSITSSHIKSDSLPLRKKI